MFPYLFVTFLLLLLSADFVLLPRSARRAWVAMTAAFAGAATMAIFPKAWIWLAASLGVGRPVDILVYAATVILVRELFLTRARNVRNERQLTELVRVLAIERVVLAGSNAIAQSGSPLQTERTKA